MTYYSVLDVTPTSEDWIDDYLPTANRLVKNTEVSIWPAPPATNR